MQSKVFIVFLLVFSFALSACTSVENDRNQVCLEGSWQVSDEETFARALIPVGALEQPHRFPREPDAIARQEYARRPARTRGQGRPRPHP